MTRGWEALFSTTVRYFPQPATDLLPNFTH
jgi:hypothetical protein